MRNAISKMWVSFRDSVGGLLDSKGTADDVKGLLWLAVVAVVFSVVGAFYYIRVVKLMYFDEPVTEATIDAPVDFRAAISLNGIMMLGLGIFSSSLIAICMASFGV